MALKSGYRTGICSDEWDTSIEKKHLEIGNGDNWVFPEDVAKSRSCCCVMRAATTMKIDSCGQKLAAGTELRRDA